MTSFDTKPHQGNDNDPQDKGTGVLRTWGGVALSLAALGGWYEVVKVSGAVDVSPSGVVRRLEENAWNGIVQSIMLHRLDAHLSQVPLLDLVNGGKEHAAFTEVSFIISQMDSCYGKGYLETSVSPDGQMSDDQRLYKACKHLQHALEIKDGEQIVLARARLSSAIVATYGSL